MTFLDMVRTNVTSGLILACFSVLAYLWTHNQDFIEKKTDQYDQTLQELLITSSGISSKMDSNRNEWELREGRVIAAMEKQNVTIDRLLEIVNQHDKRISRLEIAIERYERQ